MYTEMKLNDSVLKHSFYRGEGNFLLKKKKINKGPASINTRWFLHFKI